MTRKKVLSTKVKNIYLAGRIDKNDWRHEVVSDLRNAWDSYDLVMQNWPLPEFDWPILENSILDRFNYVGPYFQADDHGCGHGPTSHGILGIGCATLGNTELMNLTENQAEHSHMFYMIDKSPIFRASLNSIRRADLIIGFIEAESYGTITEFAYAMALRKASIAVILEHDEELWFPYLSAGMTWYSQSTDKAEAILTALNLLFPEDTSINYSEYLQSDKWKNKAKSAKERANWRCQLCNIEGNNGSLHAHHRTYERLGDELPEDITVLCANCHAKFHNKDL